MIREFEEISIGDSYSLKKTITDQMVREFADFSGDYNPIHMDEDFCRGHGLETRIVHGMLILSFLSALIGMHLPGEGTVWMSQDIGLFLRRGSATHWKSPVR
jgi:3-hydroxybutyryl-CoA dehydratase